jgi:hypothetical protein
VLVATDHHGKAETPAAARYAASRSLTWSPVVELRRYRLHTDQRETLIDLFESRLIEPQELSGMKVIGQFRDLDDPNLFIWLRGFPHMSARAAGLADFYDGPVWQRYKAAANATMIDSDNVLLLRPAHSDSAFTLPENRLDRGKAAGDDRGIVEATVVSVDAATVPDVLSLYEQHVVRKVESWGGSLLGCFVSETSPNNFPRLPVREGEHVVAWFAGFPDHDAYDSMHRAHPVARVQAAITQEHLRGAVEVLRMAPTDRSLLTGRRAGPRS